jgi:hypothetical protein
MDDRLQSILSPLADKILRADENAYSELLVEMETPESAIALLRGVKPEQLLAGPVASMEHASAMLAGLWLWHDALHESHEISQSLVSSTGSFWHAIMHRREGDFSNAKYWYARCRSHPILKTIGVAVSSSIGNPIEHEVQAGVSDDMTESGEWDPFDFVDLVESVYDRPDDPSYETAVRVQRVEWEILFAACAYAAAGKGTLLGAGIES